MHEAGENQLAVQCARDRVAPRAHFDDGGSHEWAWSA